MFKNIQFYQKVILLLWLGLSAHFVQAVVSLDDQTGTVELPANTNITFPVQATQPCSGTSGTFSFKTSVALGNVFLPSGANADRIPAGSALYIRLNLSNGAKFVSSEFHPVINGNPSPISSSPTDNFPSVIRSLGGEGKDFVTFDIRTSPTGPILFSDTLSFCIDGIQVANKKPVNLTYSIHTVKDSAEALNDSVYYDYGKIYEHSSRFLTFALHCASYNVSLPNPPNVSIPCVNAGGTNYQVNMGFISCPASSPFPFCLNVSSATQITLPVGVQCPVGFPTSGTLDGLHLDCLTVTPTESYWVDMKWTPPSLNFGVTNLGLNP
jgi:hypothetical protein